jgi:hypothetical protein
MSMFVGERVARESGPVVASISGIASAPIAATHRKESWKLASKSWSGSQIRQTSAIAASRFSTRPRGRKIAR